MKYIALALIFLMSISCVDHAPNVHKGLPHVSNANQRIEAEDVIRFRPVWESEKTIPLPANIACAISKLPVEPTPVREVTVALPTLGYFQIEDEEYRWVLSNELTTDRLYEQQKVKKLPQGLSLQRVMTTQQWEKLWNFCLTFDATEEEKAYMTKCLTDAFSKIESH